MFLHTHCTFLWEFHTICASQPPTIWWHTSVQAWSIHTYTNTLTNDCVHFTLTHIQKYWHTLTQTQIYKYSDIQYTRIQTRRPTITHTSHTHIQTHWHTIKHTLHTHTHTHTYANTLTNNYTQWCTKTLIYNYTHIYKHTDLQLRILMHTHIQAHRHTITHTLHTHIQTHWHTIRHTRI